MAHCSGTPASLRKIHHGPYDVQIENNKCRFVRDTSPPCPEYTVKITGVELVGSRGQGTQLLDSDIDVAALVILEGCKNVHEMKEHFLRFGHRDFATSLFTCLCKTEAVEVSDTYPHQNRTSCSVAGVSVDVLPALPPESLSLEDLRMCEPGVWIKTYSLNVAKTQWVSRQPEVRSCSKRCQVAETLGSCGVPSRIDSPARSN